MRKLTLILVSILVTTSMAFAGTDRMDIYVSGLSVVPTYNWVAQVTKTSNYTATSSDDLINATATSATTTITLPTISSLRGYGKKSYKIVKTDATSYAVIVAPASGDTIGGTAARRIITPNGFILVSTGTGRDWNVIYESSYLTEDHNAGSVYLGALSSTYNVYSSLDGLYKYTNGTTGTPHVLASTAGTDTGESGIVKVTETAISFGSAQTSLTDPVLWYGKEFVTDTANSALTPVVLRPQIIFTGTGLNNPVSAAYVEQSALYHVGTGTVGQLALHSGVLDLGSDAFTTTSGITGIDIAIQGSATVTGTVKGLSLDVKSGRTVEAAYSANCQTTTNAGLEITGTPKTAIRFGSSNTASASITTGALATPNDTNIKAAQGFTAAPGSIYINTVGTGTIWVMQTTTWTQLTIN